MGKHLTNNTTVRISGTAVISGSDGTGSIRIQDGTQQMMIVADGEISLTPKGLLTGTQPYSTINIGVPSGAPEVGATGAVGDKIAFQFRNWLANGQSRTMVDVGAWTRRNDDGWGIFGFDFGGGVDAIRLTALNGGMSDARIIFSDPGYWWNDVIGTAMDEEGGGWVGMTGSNIKISANSGNLEIRTGQVSATLGPLSGDERTYFKTLGNGSNNGALMFCGAGGSSKIGVQQHPPGEEVADGSASNAAGITFAASDSGAGPNTVGYVVGGWATDKVDVPRMAILSNGDVDIEAQAGDMSIKLASTGTLTITGSVRVAPAVGNYLSVTGAYAETRLTSDNNGNFAGLEVYERANTSGQPGVYLYGLGGSYAQMFVLDGGGTDRSANILLSGFFSATDDVTSLSLYSGRDPGGGPAPVASIYASPSLQIYSPATRISGALSLVDRKDDDLILHYRSDDDPTPIVGGEFQRIRFRFPNERGDGFSGFGWITTEILFDPDDPNQTASGSARGKMIIGPVDPNHSARDFVFSTTNLASGTRAFLSIPNGMDSSYDVRIQDESTLPGDPKLAIPNGGLRVSGALTASNGVYAQSTSSFSGAIRNLVEVWDDVFYPVDQAAGTGALAFDQYGTSGMYYYHWSHTQSEPLYCSWQMPHGWKRDTEVRPHIHVIPAVNPTASATVSITGAYAWSHAQATLATASWTAFSATFTVTTASAFKQDIISLFSTTPSGAKESSVLNAWFRRDVGATDTYTTNKSGGTVAANLAIISIDAHYRKEKLGTVNYIPD